MLPSISLLALLLAPLLVNGAKSQTSTGQNAIVPGQFIIELETQSIQKRASKDEPFSVEGLLSSVLTHLAKPVTTTIDSLTGGSSDSTTVTLPKFTSRRSYKSHVFAGAVVSADGDQVAKGENGEDANWEDVVKGLETINGVKRAWPVRVVPRPEPVYNADAITPSASGKYVSHLALTPNVRNNVDDYKNDVFPPHQMTGVDKLHERGVLGDGVRVGVIDTGVDYKNPILGGCFGEGCHVSFGTSLVDDNGNPIQIGTVDPYTDCSEHGTHVSGIVGALANDYGFSGVAPHADLGMYRVFGCTGSASDDIIVDALLQSIEDKCDIVTLSLGGSAGWLDQSPSQTIVERMNAMGIITTVSAGNDQSEGLFYANGPAATRTGISVGSVDVTKLPAYLAGVLGRPALPYLSALPLDLSTLPSNDLRVYFTSTDSSITNDACNALPDSTPNLANYVTVIQRGTCAFTQKLKNAAAKGAKVVLVYNSATAVSMVPYLTPDDTGIVAVGSLRREEGLRLLSYYKSNPRGTRIAFTAQDKPTSVEDTISGGIISSFSEYGPTFDLYGQPSFSAPGGNILSTFPLSMGGLGVISGTSMSCPHVAGAVALLLSQKRAQNLGPLDVRSIYASTSTGLPTTRGGSTLDSVLVQGGGLLQADKGIATGTIVSPYELQLNDTAYLNGTQQVTLKNSNNFPVTYTFSSSNAVALGNYDKSYKTDVLPSTNPSAVSGANARVTFSTSVVVVDAGSSVTVGVTVTPPRVSQKTAERFPIYSGFVNIQGSAPAWGETNENLVVPYFGLFARMVDMPVLDSTAAIYGDQKYPFVVDDTDAYITKPSTVSLNRAITVYTRLAGGTSRLTIDLIAADTPFTSTISTDRSVGSGSTSRLRLARRADSSSAGDGPVDTSKFGAYIGGYAPALAAVQPSTTLYADTPIVGNILTQGLSPRDARVSNTPNPASDTQTAINANSYSFIKSGQQYKVLVRALKITADPTLAASYESWVSYPITFE